MLDSKCRVPGATLEHGSIDTESIIVGPLPKVFWFTSERKYVWYQCGTPSHFCLVCRQTGAYRHHQATEGSLYSRSKCCRKQRLAWNVRALTADTVRPSRRAVSALVSPCNSRRRITIRKLLRRCEIARITVTRSSFSARACSGVGPLSAESGTEVASVPSLFSCNRVFARLWRSSIKASLIAMRVTHVEKVESSRNLQRFVKAR